MKKAFILFLLLYCHEAIAQALVADFSMPSPVCKEQNIYFKNLSTPTASYQWDFCNGDLSQQPVGSVLVNNYGGYGTRVELMECNDEVFGFFLSGGTQNLYRLDFGKDLTNSPAQINLGKLGLNSNQLRAITIVKEEGLYFGFIIDSQLNAVYRIEFGNSLRNNPQNITQIFQGSPLNSPFQITAVSEGALKFLFITNNGDGKLVRLKFMSSYSQTVSEAFSMVISTNWLNAVSFLKEGGLWHCASVSSLLGQIVKIDFVNGLADNTPQVSTITTVANPISVDLVNENGAYYMLAQSLNPQRSIFRLNFGSSLTNSPSISEISNIGLGSSEIWNLSVFNYKSTWAALAVEQTGQNIYRVQFPSNCFSQAQYSEASDTVVTALSSGSYSIALAVTDGNGNCKYSIKNLSVLDLTSPDIKIATQNTCINNDVFFTFLNNSGNVTSFNWDFGDGGTSTNSNPSHVYSSAQVFNTSLTVTAINGCENIVKDSIQIYNHPQASFLLPPILPICTNQDYIFENASVADSGYPVTWQWQVNGTDVSSDENLTYTFTGTNNHDISLTASIPGCESNSTQIVTSVMEGPIPDFSFVGQCEEVNVMFANNSTGTISGYSWDFDNGQGSTIENPAHAFSNQGVYDVALTVSNIAGCNNTTIKSVTIYSKPQINFEALQPPFSCNGAPTEFRDRTPNPTDSNLASWQWNFGDAGSSQNTSGLKNPQHIYNNEGVYDVSLTVFTNFLCSSSLQLPITISQTPVADFSYSAPCEDVTVDFSDESIGTIDSWEWQLGTTTYATQNPTHIFVNAGNTSATLTITASNHCIGSISKPIVVPAKLIPDFTVSKNCTNQETLFTDVTNDVVDPINAYQWEVIGGATATESPAIFTFSTSGIPNVKLVVTTQTGCAYSITKPVAIIPSPIANFTTTPEIGESPLRIQFTNASVGATTYHWAFNDAINSTSTNASPVFMYEDFGQYQVELTAFNAQNCSHTFSSLIEVLTPVTDVDPNLTYEQPLITFAPYPNPSSNGVLNINWIIKEDGIVTMKVINGMGQIVKDFQVNSAEGLNLFTLNTAGIGSGVYFVKFNYKQITQVYRVIISE